METADYESLKKENELLKEKINELEKADRIRYKISFGELIDRLCITQLKQFLITEHRDEYSKEIKDIVHDLDLMLKDIKCDAKAVRAIIILTIMNREIWLNESNMRKGIKEGNNLTLSHSLNSQRCEMKNRLQDLVVGGRKDYKIDVMEANSQWIPSWE